MASRIKKPTFIVGFFCSLYSTLLCKSLEYNLRVLVVDLPHIHNMAREILCLALLVTTNIDDDSLEWRQLICLLTKAQ